DDRIRGTKPHLESVIGPEIAIHDPSVPSDKLLLHFNPLLARCRDKSRPPEDFVQRDHRQPLNLAHAPRESRFARCSATYDDYASHRLQLRRLEFDVEMAGFKTVVLC